MTDWTDEKLEELRQEFGEKELEKSDEPFERLIVSIINQQLSTESAKAIKDRFFEKFEIEPEKILEADEGEMNEVGLSGQKIKYIRSAAEKFIEDDLSPEKFTESRNSEGVSGSPENLGFSNMSDEEVMDELTSIHGIGDWTAKMFMIFVLGREDVFPVEDLGIRRAMEELYGLDSRDEMREKAEDFRPKRSLASLYLWEFRD
ncbi:MAG: DNA-3-methyladenine glycosylase [Candidatus Nanosalina sp.]